MIERGDTTTGDILFEIRGKKAMNISMIFLSVRLLLFSFAGQIINTLV